MNSKSRVMAVSMVALAALTGCSGGTPPTTSATSSSAVPAVVAGDVFRAAISSCEEVKALLDDVEGVGLTLADGDSTLLLIGLSSSNAEMGSAWVHGPKQGGFLSLPQTMCVLDALDRPAAVAAKMGDTTPLQGMVSDSWTTAEGLSIAATWSYSSSGKFDVVLEAETPAP